MCLGYVEWEYHQVGFCTCQSWNPHLTIGYLARGEHGCERFKLMTSVEAVSNFYKY